MEYKCKICNDEFRSMWHLSNHVSKYHTNISIYDYTVKYCYNGVEPTCKCGCGEKVRHKNILQFVKYISGHNSRLESNPFKDKKQQERYRKIKDKKYGDPYYNNREQFVDTTTQRYGGVGFASGEIMRKTRETKQKLYGNPNFINMEKRKETNIKKYGFEHNTQTDDHKIKLRQHFRKRQHDLNYYGFIPNYNPSACDYFDTLMEHTGTYIQHAKNGGEVKVLGYFLDGYDKENNIAYEYDEKYHFDINGKLKTKDIRRQKEIQEFLGCEFIRIKEGEIL